MEAERCLSKKQKYMSTEEQDQLEFTEEDGNLAVKVVESSERFEAISLRERYMAGVMYQKSGMREEALRCLDSVCKERENHNNPDLIIFFNDAAKRVKSIRHKIRKGLKKQSEKDEKEREQLEREAKEKEEKEKIEREIKECECLILHEQYESAFKKANESTYRDHFVLVQFCAICKFHVDDDHEAYKFALQAVKQSSEEEIDNLFLTVRYILGKGRALKDRCDLQALRCFESIKNEMTENEKKKDCVPPKFSQFLDMPKLLKIIGEYITYMKKKIEMKEKSMKEKEERVTKEKKKKVNEAKESDFKKEESEEEELREEKDGKEEKENEEEEEEKERGEREGKKENESEKRNKEKEISLIVNFAIKDHQDEIYQGVMLYSNGEEREVSFLPFKEKTTEQFSLTFNNLLSMQKFCHRSLLSPYFLVDDTDSRSQLMVVERVHSLDGFFEMMKIDFEKKEKNELVVKDTARRWWSFIKEKFTEIFGDVVRGMLFVFVKDQSIEHEIYVGVDDRGKIIPSSCGSQSNSIDHLLSKMKYILNLPFKEGEVGSFDDFQMPCELKSFLDYAWASLNTVNPIMLIDSPYFWASHQRTTFIFKLRDMLKQNLLSSNVLENCLIEVLISNGRFQPSTTGSAFCYPTWYYEIPKDSVLWKMYARAQSKAKSATASGSQGEFQRPQPYISECCIIRFCIAVYNHYNDWNYKDLRDTNQGRAEIESLLGKTFPDLYTNLVRAIYTYQTSEAQFDREGLMHQLLSIIDY